MPESITQIDHSFTDAPVVPDIDIQTEEEYDDAARGWFYYWKNTILAEVTAFITKLNTFKDQVNTMATYVAGVQEATYQIKTDTNAIKIATEGYRDTTEGYRDETLSYINATIAGAFDIGGWTAGVKDAGTRTKHKGSLWLSKIETSDEPTRASSDWLWLVYVEDIITITENYTAKEGDVIFVNPTTVGNDITITVPDAFTDLSVLRVISTDSVNTHNVYIVPEAVLIIDGDGEGVEVSCQCDVSYVKYQNQMIRR